MLPNKIRSENDHENTQLGRKCLSHESHLNFSRTTRKEGKGEEKRLLVVQMRLDELLVNGIRPQGMGEANEWGMQS